MLLQNPGGHAIGSGSFPAQEPDDMSGHAHRQLIGILGLSLPVLVWIIARFRPTKELPGIGLLDSVSAYYYTGAVAVFVGVLAALAVFLCTYQGYDNPSQKLDRRAALVAGIAAALVAFFPTLAPKEVTRLEWWTEWMGYAHLGSATVLFGSFIFFSLVLFPKSKNPDAAGLPRDKKVRNTIYYACGWAMVICILWIAVNRLVLDSSIFWPEALALEFFAVSWLAKGRADQTAVAIAKRIALRPAVAKAGA